MAAGRADFTLTFRAGNVAPLDELLGLIAKSYGHRPDLAGYSNPPQPEEVVHQTFCGT